MDIAQQYAKALSESKKPNLKALKESLSARGREKLLPRIYAEYQTLLLKSERSEAHAAVTPQSERTRVLLGLYRTLIK